MTYLSRPRQATAEAKAREIIQKLGITSPSDIDIELIVSFRGVPLKRRPLTGCDGMMVRNGKKGCISVRNNINNTARERFVIAHELGHFLLHEHVRQADNFSMSKFERMSYRGSHEEMEANYFAAELLMPKAMFTDAINKSAPPSFEEIERLASLFNTSLSATAIQYVKYSKQPCVFIITKDLGNPWCYKTDDFEFWVESREKIHQYSVTADAVSNRRSTDRASDVPAGIWLQGYEDDGKEYITEEALVLDSGIVYTLLWLHEAI
jgi:Zn-dependent peptidase ImmA (M78 family)